MNGGSYKRFSYPALAILALTAVIRLRADVLVGVSADGFAPSSVNIAVGQTVWWVVRDDQGPYTISSFAGDWIPQYLYDEGDSIGLTFNEAGDYSYYDAFSYNSGVVHVGTAPPVNIPPTGQITAPQDGSIFTAPGNFAMSVDASDPDDGVMDVEFYVGDTLIDDVWDAPYTTTVTNLAAGVYTLKVVVYDYTGDSVSQTVSITVQGGQVLTPSLSAPVFDSGQLQLTLSGLMPGKTIVLQSSADLGRSSNWSAIQTNVAGASTMALTAPAQGQARFFRVLQLP